MATITRLVGSLICDGLRPGDSASNAGLMMVWPSDYDLCKLSYVLMFSVLQVSNNWKGRCHSSCGYRWLTSLMLSTARELHRHHHHRHVPSVRENVTSPTRVVVCLGHAFRLSRPPLSSRSNKSLSASPTDSYLAGFYAAPLVKGLRGSSLSLVSVSLNHIHSMADILYRMPVQVRGPAHANLCHLSIHDT